MKIVTFEDILEIEKTPLSQQSGGVRNTYDVIRKSAEKSPHSIAIKYMAQADLCEEPETISYGRFFEHINQTANLFHHLGLKSDEVVSFLLPNVPQTHYVLWGGEAAGIVNPVNYMLDVDHIIGILKAAGTKILVSYGPAAGIDIWEKTLQIMDQVPSLEHILQVKSGSEAVKTQIVKAKANIQDFDQAIQEQNGAGLDSGRNIKGDDICSLFHTGGTTGTPKLAQHSHLNEVSNAIMVNLVSDRREDDVSFCGLPLFHVNGALITGISCFIKGSTVLLATPFGFRTPGLLNNFWKLVEREKITFISVVPTIITALLEVPLQGEDIRSLSTAICGAAPLPVEIIRRFEEKSGMKLSEGYGLTEGSFASSSNPKYGERRAGSIGFRLPYQDMKCMIVDTEGNYSRDCAVGEIGSVAIKGPNVFQGYLQPEANKGVWPGDGWFNTGDMGRMDAENYFWLTGRSKELIIRGGHNIDPAVIENALIKHAAVAAVAAVGKPDAYAGELPVAYVVLRPGETMDEKSLIDFARSNISERAAVPKNIYILDHLPLTAVGKVFKPELKRDAMRREILRATENIKDIVAVRVENHATHGTLATVEVASHLSDAIKGDIRDILGQYAFQFELKTV